MTRRYVRDLIERVCSTAAQAFIGQLLLALGDVQGVVDFSTLKKAGVAAAIATLSLVKGLLARTVGDSESASLAKPPIVA
jgi:hypothetical protein